MFSQTNALKFQVEIMKTPTFRGKKQTPETMRQLQQHSGAFNDCKGCDQAMASVMDANLLLFKTVIAGDSWGEIAVPIIKNYPGTFDFFSWVMFFDMFFCR